MMGVIWNLQADDETYRFNQIFPKIYCSKTISLPVSFESIARFQKIEYILSACGQIMESISIVDGKVF